ncbi:MAG: c-type cytochrome domain-containing protein [Pseudomonadota bacterium]|nr:c-type cytochrome domain-containing protein [Pseudomonadota bacterium]
MSYAWDVQPILQQKCEQCHTPPDGEGYVLSGLDVTSYEGLVQGSRYGRVIVPGNSRHSVFNMAGEGRIHPNLRASRGRMPLSTREAEILRSWVDQGAADN